MMLGELRKIFLDCIHGRLPGQNIFRDISLLNEMRTFVPDPNTNIARALNGCYDDRVIALAITHQAASDEAFCTGADLIHAYHQYQPSAQQIEQKANRQKIKPSEVLSSLLGGRTSTRGLGANRFEINNDGRITGWPEQ